VDDIRNQQEAQHHSQNCRNQHFPSRHQPFNTLQSPPQPLPAALVKLVRRSFCSCRGEACRYTCSKLGGSGIQRTGSTEDSRECKLFLERCPAIGADFQVCEKLHELFRQPVRRRDTASDRRYVFRMRSFWRPSLGILSWIGFAAKFDPLDVTRHLLENSTWQNGRRTPGICAGISQLSTCFVQQRRLLSFLIVMRSPAGVKATTTATAARASLDLSRT